MLGTSSIQARTDSTSSAADSHQQRAAASQAGGRDGMPISAQDELPDEEGVFFEEPDQPREEAAPDVFDPEAGGETEDEESEYRKLLEKIRYSSTYTDDQYEYRHLILPKQLVKLLPKNRLMSETEWRDLGIRQSHGWVHYLVHTPEPHILLFRRERDYIQKYGNMPRPPN